ncbi:MAG: methionine adenosyltransferase domain-containing protein, partial [Oscillospiraceae bacterium]
KNTGIYSDSEIEKAICEIFDMRPASIIKQLDLRKPIYRNLAAYGHMGREDLGVSWERTDKTNALKAYFTN